MIDMKFNCESKVLEILIEWNISLRNFTIGIIRIDVSVFEEPVEEFTWHSTEIRHIKKQVTLILRIRWPFSERKYLDDVVKNVFYHLAIVFNFSLRVKWLKKPWFSRSLVLSILSISLRIRNFDGRARSFVNISA